MSNVPRRYLFSSAVMIFIFAGCAFVDRTEIAVVTKDDYFGDSATTITYTEQNWDDKDSVWFYTTTQGSNLIPYDIFLNIEQSDNDKLFLDSKNIEKFRYLPQKPSTWNPDGLPVGFVKDSYDQDYIGFTCAACHTTQINYKDVGMRIDGAPAMADMEMMLMELEKALKSNLDNPGKRDRFIKRTLGTDGSSSESVSSLTNKLKKAHYDIKLYNDKNAPIHYDNNGNKENIRYGYARLDAVGRILNRTLLHLGGKENAIPGTTEGSLKPTTKTISPTAPVSYPFLWDTPQHDFVQWNGLLENKDGFIGPLGRNTGEVVGVFATIDIEADYSFWDFKKINKKVLSYHSSVEVRNLIRLEEHLESLWSPQWQALSESEAGPLPNIDIEKAERGEAIYKQYGCLACHHDINREDKDRKIIAQLASLENIKTDRNMARQAIESCGDSGVLFETAAIDGMTPCPSNQLDNKADNPKNDISALDAVSVVTTGVLKEGIFNSTYLTLQSAIEFFSSFFEDLPNKRIVDFEIANKNYLNAYKGRPLNGIWATAPYLHNGSVPNLYELFLPACTQDDISSGRMKASDCRSVKFTVGRREFDPVKVGFVLEDLSSYSPKPNEPSLFVFDTKKYGNKNTGHEYAAGKDFIPPLTSDGKVDFDKLGDRANWRKMPPLSHDQRMDLLEYLKAR